MSAVAAVSTPGAQQGVSQKLAYGETYVKGRLIGARRPGAQGGLWSHLVILPAPDEYSSPATIEILSKQRLGERDEDVTVKVRIGGYKRSYKSTDRETGEIKQVQTADNKLFAVED